MRLLTPRGIGGVAVVVAEGPAERGAVLACLTTRSGGEFKTGPMAPPARLSWAGELRDEVLVVDRGQRGLELHLHASPLLIAAFERQFGPFGPSASGPGELLLQQALSAEQLALGLEQRQHDFGAFLRGLRQLPPAEHRAELAAAQRRSRVARALASPCRLVLIGRQNAGKSTLFNRLLFRERALTGGMPGLTRDPVRERTSLGGYPYLLVDTAGEGVSGSSVDARAGQRARLERQASLCLLVVDASVGPGDIDRDLLGPDVLPEEMPPQA